MSRRRSRQRRGVNRFPSHSEDLAEQKPEAVYFIDEGGKRTGILVIDLKEPSQIPAIAEPWFLALNAAVEIHPAMKPEDLAKAGPAVERSVREFRG